jgi:hypothetical protein
MSKIKGKQINQLVGQAHWNTTGIAVPSAASVTVTTAFTGKAPGGSDALAGVYTTTPHNKVFLRNAATGKPLVDLENESSIFGRLTESGGTWLVSFFSLVSGIETAFDFTADLQAGATFDFRWCESVQIGVSTPSAIVYAGEGIDEFDASSPASHLHIVESPAITTNGQTGFALAQTPKDINDLALTVNGIRYKIGVDFSVLGTTVTWLDVDFTLQTTDTLLIEYAY